MEITERSVQRVSYHQETVSVNLALVDCPDIAVHTRRDLQPYTLVLTYTRINGGSWIGKWALVGTVGYPKARGRRETNIHADHFRDGCEPPAWCDEYLARYRKDLPQ